MPHCNTQQYSSETIRISQPVANSPITNERQVVPWKRALPSQPNMGIRKESWEKNFKRGEMIKGDLAKIDVSLSHNVQSRL